MILAIIAIILSYLAGSIPFAYIVVKLMKGTDIRNVGSGNVGFTNPWYGYTTQPIYWYTKY